MIFEIKSYIPIASEAAATPAHVFASKIHVLRADVAGSVQARLRDDGATDWVTYTLAAGEYLYGDFVAIQSSTFGAGELVGLTLPVK